MIINEAIIENLLYGEEGDDLDFKREQYKFVKASDGDKGEMLKDIIAFANSWRRSDAFILIGVEEIKGGRSKVVGINEKLDDASIQQFVNSKTQRPVSFSYRNHEFEGKCIGIIHIPIQDRPFYLKNDYGKLKKGTVYIKRGSSTDTAELDEIARMGTSSFIVEDKHPTLELFFADKENRLFLPDTQNLFSLVLEPPSQKKIPDYKGDRYRRPVWVESINNESPNRDYYRELVTFTTQNELLSPVNFVIKNSSSVVAKDVRIEIKIKDQDNLIKALDEYHMPEVPKSSYPTFGHINHQVQNVGVSHDLTVRRISDYWLIETGVEKVQPQNNEWIHSRLYIGALESVDCAMEVSIFSDDLPEPTIKRLLFKIQSEKKKVNLEEIEELEAVRYKNSWEYKIFLEWHKEQST